MSENDPGCVKTQIPKRDENDILAFDLEIERACNSGVSNGLERLTCSIAIQRPRVFTQPRPRADMAGLFRWSAERRAHQCVLGS